MSMRMQYAKARMVNTTRAPMVTPGPARSTFGPPQRGEGILGAIGGALGGFFTGGIGGAVGGAISGWKGGGSPPARPGTGQYGPMPQPPGRPPRPPVINTPFDGYPGSGINVGPFRAGIGQNGGAQVPVEMKAPSGYHWNKTSYFLRDGTFVPKGTKLVKNRRRNPLNPRALSRSISRIKSAKKAAEVLGRVTVRKKKC